jgi:threonine/homoserine/homoserine lactone efflux protein
MILSSMGVLAVSLLLLCIKPGPFTIAVVARSIADGFWSGFAMSLGCTTMHVVYFLTAVFGFSIIETHLEFFSFFLKSIGMAYLMYMGVKGLMNINSGLWSDQNTPVTTPLSFIENYLAGLSITLSNPFTILFYVAVIPQILSIHDLRWNDITILTFTLLTVHLSYQASISYLSSRASYFLKQPHIVRGINIGVSVIFILIGLYLGLSMLRG